MGFGVIGTSVLVAGGASAAAASAVIHAAKLGTAVISGTAHWRFGNVHWRTVWAIGLPGMVGAFLGASLLARWRAAPWLRCPPRCCWSSVSSCSARFAFGATPPAVEPASIRRALLVPLGLVGGAIDAVGGGGWGPVATPSLMGPAKMDAPVGHRLGRRVGVPRRARARRRLRRRTSRRPASSGVSSGALMAGALVAAPVAAWAVKILPVRVLGTFVGALIVTLNLHTILSTVGLPSCIVATVVVACVPAGLVLVGRSLVAERRDRALTGGPDPVGGAPAGERSGDVRVGVPVAGPPVAGSRAAGPAGDQGRS